MTKLVLSMLNNFDMYKVYSICTQVIVKMDAMGAEPNQDIAQLTTSQADEIGKELIIFCYIMNVLPNLLCFDDTCFTTSERKARVESVWQQMNKGVSEKTLKSILNKQSSNLKRTSPKPSSQVRQLEMILSFSILFIGNSYNLLLVFIPELDDSFGIFTKEDSSMPQPRCTGVSSQCHSEWDQ